MEESHEASENVSTAGTTTREGGVPSGPLRSRALGAPRDPERGSITPTPNFIAFSGALSSGAWIAMPIAVTSRTAAAAAAAASPTLC